MKKGTLVVLGALIAFWAAPAFAQVECLDTSASPPCFVEESTKPPSGSPTPTNATVVTWDSSYQDPGYTLGATNTMTVTWTVDYGAAEYHSFSLKQKKGEDYPNAFTPRGGDPAAGQVPLVLKIEDFNEVEVEFEFTMLHLDRRRNCDIGNAHFKLFLNIDKDGDGVPETVVGYGVNVHVEDPQDPQDTVC